MWGCTKRCTGSCTWAAHVVALVDAMKHECVQNVSSNGGPATSLESVIDDGLNGGFEWVP